MPPENEDQPTESELRWVLQHKRRWPVFLALAATACLSAWLAAQANGRRLARADLVQDELALQELVAAKERPAVAGNSVASILERAAALLPELPDDQYRMDQGGVDFDWHSAWRHEAFFTGPDNLIMIDAACAPAWEVFDTLTDELPSGWQVDYGAVYMAKLFMIDHVQSLVKALRLRLWCAARRGDWATIDATAERWALVCDRVAEIGFLITHLVAVSLDSALCQTLLAAGHLSERPLSDQILQRCERLADERAHRPGDLAAAVRLETIATRWCMSRLAIERDLNVLKNLLGYELRMLAQSDIQYGYPITYPVGRPFGEAMMHKLAVVAKAIDQRGVTATSSNTGAGTLDREFIDFRTRIDPRYSVTYLTLPAIEMIGRNSTHARHRWLLLPIALRLLHAARPDPTMNLQSTNTASDRLVDPASPTDEFFRLEQHGEAWLLRGRGFDGRLGEHIDPGERLSDDAGIWLYPALLPPPTTEEGP